MFPQGSDEINAEADEVPEIWDDHASLFETSVIQGSKVPFVSLC